MAEEKSKLTMWGSLQIEAQQLTELKNDLEANVVKINDLSKS